MTTRYVVAIVPAESVQPLQAQLHALGVKGMTLTRVRGFGEYKNFYSDDGLTEHVKLEMFVQASEVEPLLAALVQWSRLEGPGAGVAAVLKVDAFVHRRTGTEILFEPATAAAP